MRLSQQFTAVVQTKPTNIDTCKLATVSPTTTSIHHSKHPTQIQNQRNIEQCILNKIVNRVCHFVQFKKHEFCIKLKLDEHGLSNRTLVLNVGHGDFPMGHGQNLSRPHRNKGH
jgi:hypothetical protein